MADDAKPTTGPVAAAKLPPEVPIVRMPLAKLKGAKYNPREITKEAMTGLESSLDKFGLVQPIVWNKRSGNVVGGHQRVRALRKRKVREADVAVVDLSDLDEKALNVALNSPTISGTFRSNIGSLLDEIAAGRKTLFASMNLGDLRAGAITKRTVTFETKNDGAPGLGAMEHRIMVMCADEEEQAALLERFEAEGLTVQPLII